MSKATVGLFKPYATRIRRPITKPTAAFIYAHPARWIAFGFGSGLSPIMPGTLGTLFAWVSFGVLNAWLDPLQWALVLFFGYFLGVAVCSKTGHDMQVHDHGGMVWDEIIAFWLVLWLLSPADFSTQCWAFFWFRLFDMTKPPPIGYFDAHLHGKGWWGMKDGFGVMFDDIFAAFYTLLLFAIWRTL